MPTLGRVLKGSADVLDLTADEEGPELNEEQSPEAPISGQQLLPKQEPTASPDEEPSRSPYFEEGENARTSEGSSTELMAPTVTQLSQELGSDEASPPSNASDEDAPETPRPVPTTSLSQTELTPMSESKMTRVDGKGLWRSWKRNFNTKLLALLDLIDNSFDASIKGMEQHDDPNFRGRVHIFPDVHSWCRDDGQSTMTTTGLCIVNNCLKPIRPLEKVLEVYNSSKVESGAGDIGENGVGLKQGCATLSDLSFVLVKNGSNDKIELGIIAESLQTLGGCYLPAFQFSNGQRRKSQPSLKRQMTALFQKPENLDVAQCIAQYGAASIGSAPSLEVGIDRLCDHFDRICYQFWDNKYVFAVVLDKLRHGSSEKALPGDQEHKIRVGELAKELQDQIPRTYLHVPDSFDFNIRKGDAPEPSVVFKYWPERLVEFSSFTVGVNTNQLWHENFGSYEHHPKTYKLRIFLGFDAMRITQKESRKEASLYVYSRQSGRLINRVPDARTLLGLSAGGTTFCSGLTIIIDDIEGRLPLNPTKQEVAFGEEECGEIHKENLYKWVGAITNVYYTFHLRKFDDKKTILTREIAKFGSEVEALKRRNAHSNELKSCDHSKLTTFDLEFSQWAKKNIRVDWKTMMELVGPDTRFRLLSNNPSYGKRQTPPSNTPSAVQSNMINPPVQPVHPMAPVAPLAPVASMAQVGPIAPAYPNQQMVSSFAPHAAASANPNGLVYPTGFIHDSGIHIENPKAQGVATSADPVGSPQKTPSKKRKSAGSKTDEVVSNGSIERPKRAKQSPKSYRESEYKAPRAKSAPNKSSANETTVFENANDEGDDDVVDVTDSPIPDKCSSKSSGRNESVDDSALNPVSNEDDSEAEDKEGCIADLKERIKFCEEIIEKQTNKLEQYKKKNHKLKKENEEMKGKEKSPKDQSKSIAQRDEQIQQLIKDSATMIKQMQKLRNENEELKKQLGKS